MSEKLEIQELLQKEVYVGDTLVGVIVGERFHPRDEFVRSMRIQVLDGVAEEYMRKPADHAPLHKELVHSIRPDGSVKLSKSMRELQRRWRKNKINFQLKFARTIIPQLRAMHHIRGETPEECMLIATMNVRSIVFLCMADVPEYAEYLKNCSFESVFLWLKRFFQVLELTNRPKRWLLKDPSHIGHIPEILSAYPNAKFINIHRDPLESIGSFCSLTKNVRLGFTKSVNKKRIGETVLDFWEHKVNKGIADKKVLHSATHVVLINSFSRFIPSGKENRPIKLALNRMMDAINTPNEASMLSKFHVKAHKPNHIDADSIESNLINISDLGRVKLKKDLKLLIDSDSLPIGLNTLANVLIVNSEEDNILANQTKAKLAEDLRKHLKFLPKIINLQDEGHSITKIKNIKKIKHWLEFNHAKNMV